MGPSRLCGVCNGAQSKYKCPTCLLPYCSLACFKNHKEVTCKKPSQSEEKLEDPCKKHSEEKSYLPELTYQIEEESHILQTAKFNSIVGSSELRGALKDEDLRRLVKKIDSSVDPEIELEKAMEGHVFRDFTDKILAIISPQD